MPPSTPIRGGTRRRAILALLLLAIGCGIYGFINLGFFLAQEDELQPADAILVLSGTTISRALEGADLYLEGHAPRIVLSQDQPPIGMPELAARGILFVTGASRTHWVLLQLGIPDQAILIPEQIHGNTAAEAITLREMATREGWNRVIVVSSRYHLRRAAFAFRRELRGTEIQVLMRRTRYENFEPDQWWRRRRDIRAVVEEMPRLAAYVLGLRA
ncbi:MAG: YdcF family protein [Acidobacteria bacterium]|nr:YdcF family protein [Acidobacteriota bacterium]